jgi:hypothetical protein
LKDILLTFMPYSIETISITRKSLLPAPPPHTLRRCPRCRHGLPCCEPSPCSSWGRPHSPPRRFIPRRRQQHCSPPLVRGSSCAPSSAASVPSRMLMARVEPHDFSKSTAYLRARAPGRRANPREAWRDSSACERGTRVTCWICGRRPSGGMGATLAPAQGVLA